MESSKLTFFYFKVGEVPCPITLFEDFDTISFLLMSESRELEK